MGAARVQRNEARARRLALVLADRDAPAALVETLRELERAVRTDRATLARLEASPHRRTAPEPEEILASVATALSGPPDVVRHQLRVLLADERIDVVQQDDGSIVARSALDLGALMGPQNAKSTPHFRGVLRHALRGRSKRAV